MLEEGEIEIQNQCQSSKLETNSHKSTLEEMLVMMRGNNHRIQNLQQTLQLFQPIEQNIYIERNRKFPNNQDFFACECCVRSFDNNGIQYSNRSYNCEEKCLNRMISMECDDEICGCGDMCSNRKFQKNQYLDVYPERSGDKGWGLYAGQHISKGQFIIQYVGEVFALNSKIGQQRVDYYIYSPCTYLMKTSKKQVIDATYKGNLSRFINHSCQPNCITQKWNVLGEICIGIFAYRDINEGQQLTFDYQFDVLNAAALNRCLCGSRKCKGYLGFRPSETEVEQWNERLEKMACEICHKSYEDDDTTLIICDECNGGFHLFCVDPPIQQIPENQFLCSACCGKKMQRHIDKNRNQIQQSKVREYEECGKNSKQKVINQVYARFQEYIPQLLQKIQKIRKNSLFNENKTGKNIPIKKKLLPFLIKIQPTLITPLGLVIYLDVNRYPQSSMKNMQITVFAYRSHIDILESIINTATSIMQLIDLDTITTACLNIPAIFLKTVMAMHITQKNHGIKIQYDKRYINDKCYTMEQQCRVMMKGNRGNILKINELISSKIRELYVQRIYLSPVETKTIRYRIIQLKKNRNSAEIRISRQPPFKQINHPFYQIHEKNKEVTIIGTQQQINATKTEIIKIVRYSLHQQNIQMTALIAPVSFKKQLLYIKPFLERQISHVKLILSDPTPPRKNLTVCLIGTSRSRQKAKQYLYQTFNYRNNSLEFFQDYARTQQTHCYFKFMQNCLSTKHYGLMKNWDIITLYYEEQAYNYLQLNRRGRIKYDKTLFYLCFVLKKQILDRFSRSRRFRQQIYSQILNLVRKILVKLLNFSTYNRESLKKYKSVINAKESKIMFERKYPDIQFYEKRLDTINLVYNRKWSAFEKKTLKNSGKLLMILEREMLEAEQQRVQRYCYR